MSILNPFSSNNEKEVMRDIDDKARSVLDNLNQISTKLDKIKQDFVKLINDLDYAVKRPYNLGKILYEANKAGQTIVGSDMVRFDASISESIKKFESVKKGFSNLNVMINHNQIDQCMNDIDELIAQLNAIKKDRMSFRLKDFVVYYEDRVLKKYETALKPLFVSMINQDEMLKKKLLKLNQEVKQGVYSFQ